jgi:hypothetical protein
VRRAGDPVVLGQREDREGVAVQILAAIERRARVGRRRKPAAVPRVPEAAEELEAMLSGRRSPVAGPELGDLRTRRAGGRDDQALEAVRSGRSGPSRFQ